LCTPLGSPAFASNSHRQEKFISLFPANGNINQDEKARRSTRRGNSHRAFLSPPDTKISLLPE
jgi:hypothetical protein